MRRITHQTPLSEIRGNTVEITEHEWNLCTAERRQCLGPMVMIVPTHQPPTREEPIALVFMNEKIRDRRSRDQNVIRIQHACGAITDAPTVLLNGPAVVYFSRKPNPKIKTHDVRAWIEIAEANVSLPKGTK